MTAIEQAKAYALKKAGLKWERLQSWSDSDRRAYLAALGEFRQQNAHLFTAAELSAASNYVSAGAQPDIRFNVAAEFTKEIGNQVGEFADSVASVGEGIKSGLNLTRYLIPLALVVLAGLAVWRLSSFVPSKPAATAKPARKSPAR